MISFQLASFGKRALQARPAHIDLSEGFGMSGRHRKELWHGKRARIDA